MQVFKAYLVLSSSFPDPEQIDTKRGGGTSESLETFLVHSTYSLRCCLMLQKLFGLCGVFFCGTVLRAGGMAWYISHTAASLACSPTCNFSIIWTPGCQQQPGLLHGGDESHFWPRSHSSLSTERSMWSQSCTSMTCGGSGSGMRRWGVFSLLVIPSTFNMSFHLAWYFQQILFWPWRPCVLFLPTFFCMFAIMWW